MGFFGKRKKENADFCCCGCGQQEAARGETDKASGGVKVLGSGCAKCEALERAVREALAELGMETEIEHVTDFVQIAAYGVMTTPALVVDGAVVSCGRVLSKEQVREILRKCRG